MPVDGRPIAGPSTTGSQHQPLNGNSSDRTGETQQAQDDWGQQDRLTRSFYSAPIVDPIAKLAAEWTFLPPSARVAAVYL